MATHSSVLAWRIPGRGSLVGCRLWGRIESDMTKVTAAAAAARGRYINFLISIIGSQSLKYVFNQHLLNE